jgi:hypothetical protein
MPIPIQIINNKPNCDGYNGNLNSFEYGLTNEYKQKLLKEYKYMGALAQYNVYSPYYIEPKLDMNYINFLQATQDCKSSNQSNQSNQNN